MNTHCILFEASVFQFALERTTFKTKNYVRPRLKNLKDSLSSETYPAIHIQVKQGKDVWKTKRFQAMCCLFSLSQSTCTVVPKCYSTDLERISAFKTYLQIA